MIKKYTQAEIRSNIEKNQMVLDKSLLQRKAINKTIRAAKEQIKYWQELDQSRIKLF